MFRAIAQTPTVVSVNLQGLSGRMGLVGATMLCVALVVATLLALDALNQGLRNTIAKSGDENVAIVMRGGSQAEINSRVTKEQLDILRNAPGVGILSPEANLVVDGFRKSDGARANISLRGITGAGIDIRKGTQLSEGRWPAVGAAELVVGVNVAQTYRGMDIGDQVEFGSANWTIVGHFESGGSVYESEIWGDLTAVQNLFDRANTVQSVRIGVDGNSGLSIVSDFSEHDPRLQLSVRSEADYYAAQASRSSELAQYLAWPLAILMAIGALIGAINTMLSSVSSRATEIATLRVVGYRRLAVFLGLLIECTFICLVAGVIGSGLSYLLLDGLSASTLGGGITQIGYSLEFTPLAFIQGIALAIAIGILGAIIPAGVASLQPVTQQLG
ncbi:MAG: ABC transporter permease [Pseudomonadota bacterium]